MARHHLHDAVRAGKMGNVRAILMDEPCAVLAADATGNLAIHYAARRGNSTMLNLLIQADPSTVGEPNYKGETPMHVAACCANITAIRALAKVVDPSLLRAKDDRGNTPLHCAAANGREGCGEAFAELFEMDRAPSHEVNKDGNTPLHLAADSSNLRAVKLLLNAAPHIAYTVNSYSETPLHCAARSGNKQSVEILLRVAPLAATAQAVNMITPTYLAAQSGNVEGLELLLTLLPDSAAWADLEGYQPVMVAAMNGHAAAVDTLMKVAPDTAEDMEPEDGYNAMHLAVCDGDEDVVEVLLRHRPSLATTLTADGESPLHVALTHFEESGIAHLEDEIAVPIVARLLAVEPSLATLPAVHAGQEDCLPLHVAAYMGLDGCVRELLRVAPEAVLARNDVGRTPLDCALYNDELFAAMVLLKAPMQKAEQALSSLAQHASVHREDLYVEAVAHFAPLTAECWSHVPREVAGIEMAFRECVERGTAMDVANLVARMMPWARAKMLAQLCTLSHVCPSLPSDIMQTIVSLAMGV